MKHDRLLPTKTRKADETAECPTCGLTWSNADAKKLATIHTSETGHQTILSVVHQINIKMD